MLIYNSSCLTCVLLCMLFLACSQNYSDKPSHEALAERGFKAVDNATPHSEMTIAVTERKNYGDLSAVPPTGWEQLIPSSSMRLAEFRIPGEPAENEDATLAVFYFVKGQGGTVEQNIDRWYGQFEQPDGSSTRQRARRWQDNVYGMSVTMVDISGTFSTGMGTGSGFSEPAVGYRMLGAIVESENGRYFFKLVGPDATVTHWRESFSAFVSSIQ